jgi:hypothetical protein
LLEDCHLLSSGGITDEELEENFDTVLGTLRSYMNNEQIVLNIFQLLALISDRSIMKNNTQQSINGSGSSDRSPLMKWVTPATDSGSSLLMKHIETALENHSMNIPVQRAGLQLFEQMVKVTLHTSSLSIVLRSVMKNIQLHSSDSSVLFPAFSILDTIAACSRDSLTLYRSDILNGCVLAINTRFSPEIICKCFSVADKLIDGDDQLLLIINNEKGLLMLTDGIDILRYAHIDTVEIILNMMLCCLESDRVVKAIFSRDNRISLSRLVSSELKRSISFLLAEIDRYSFAVDEMRLQTITLWIDQITVRLQGIGDDDLLPVSDSPASSFSGDNCGDADGDEDIFDDAISLRTSDLAELDYSDRKVPPAATTTQEETAGRRGVKPPPPNMLSSDFGNEHREQVSNGQLTTNQIAATAISTATVDSLLVTSQLSHELQSPRPELVLNTEKYCDHSDSSIHQEVSAPPFSVDRRLVAAVSTHKFAMFSSPFCRLFLLLTPKYWFCCFLKCVHFFKGNVC